MENFEPQTTYQTLNNSLNSINFGPKALTKKPNQKKLVYFPQGFKNPQKSSKNPFSLSHMATSSHEQTVSCIKKLLSNQEPRQKPSGGLRNYTTTVHNECMPNLKRLNQYY